MPYLEIGNLNRFQLADRKTKLKPIAIIKSEKGDKLHNHFLYLDFDDRPSSTKKIKIKLPYQCKFEPLPDVNCDKRDVFFIAGASGSGKSYFTMKLINKYSKLFPERKIFIVSRLDSDETLDQIKSKNIIKLDIEDLAENGFDVNDPLFYKSVFIFDDVDNLPNKKHADIVQNMINSISIMGRLHNKKSKHHDGQGCISLIFISHYLNNNKKSKIILNESKDYVLFPKSTAFRQLQYLLENYIGLTKKDIIKLKKMPSRWVHIHKNYPNYFISEGNAEILFQEI